MNYPINLPTNDLYVCKKQEHKYIDLLFLLELTAVLLQYYFLYNYNLHLASFLNIILNVVTVSIIVIYKIRNYRSSYNKFTYSQLKDYLKILSETNESPTLAFIHDLKNISFAVSNHMYLHDYDKANRDIDSLCSTMHDVNNKRYIGIYGIDKLISSKVKAMKKYNIKFDFENELSCPVNVDILDLCIIIGNSLNNAIEACSKIPSYKNKYINLSVFNNNDLLEITVCNSIQSKSTINFKTTKSNKMYHGFGIKNIKAVLKKYDGCLSTEQYENYFTLSMKLNTSAKDVKH